MPSSNQVIGHGSTLVMGTATPPAGAWTGTGEVAGGVAVAGVTAVGHGSHKIDAVKNTDMLTSGTTHTFIPGMEDTGDVTVKLNVKPGDTTQMAFHATKGQAFDFKTVAAGTGWTRSYSGILVSYDPDITDDKIPTITAKIKISGPITDLNF